MNADTPRSFADSCIIFMFFKSFMVKLAVLCVFASLCDKWFYWFCKGLSRMWKERSQETGVRRQNGAEYSKRHSARRVSRMREKGVQNEGSPRMRELKVESEKSEKSGKQDALCSTTL